MEHNLQFVKDELNLVPAEDPSGGIVHLLQSLARMVLVEIESMQSVGQLKAEHPRSFNEEVRRLEITLINRALARARGNQREAAKLLQLKPSTLNEKIKRYQIKYSTVHQQSDVDS